ncbi:MAG: NUDIX domain-containing protein [Candidatus Bathyarchaeia archaeon]
MKGPSVTVDIIIVGKDGSFVLIRRSRPPFEGYWAIPGGFVELGERVEDAAIREAKEETGLDVALRKIVGVYSDPERDPRGHVISVCFLAEEVGGELKKTEETTEVKRFNSIPNKIAFDHEKILRNAGFGSS